VMASFSSTPAGKVHGDRHLLTEVLKDELGFTGFVVSDWAGVDQVATDYSVAVARSIMAGMDMVMVRATPCFQAAVREVWPPAPSAGTDRRRGDADLRVKFEMGCSSGRCRRMKDAVGSAEPGARRRLSALGGLLETARHARSLVRTRSCSAGRRGRHRAASVAGPSLARSPADHAGDDHRRCAARSAGRSAPLRGDLRCRAGPPGRCRDRGRRGAAVRRGIWRLRQPGTAARGCRPCRQDATPCRSAGRHRPVGAPGHA
jgi:hypothetical protein